MEIFIFLDLNKRLEKSKLHRQVRKVFCTDKHWQDRQTLARNLHIVPSQLLL